MSNIIMKEINTEQELRKVLDIKKLTAIDDSLLNTITEWMYEWWGEKEGYSFEVIKCYMEHSLQEDRLPQTYGLFVEDCLIGLYQFRLDDLFVRPDIYPWLANVYIDSPYRNKGYGRHLMESIKSNARQCLQYKEVFLYTKHKGLYEKYGWEFVSEIDTYLEDAEKQRLYKLSL